jgi:hypothetical protein
MHYSENTLSAQCRLSVEDEIKMLHKRVAQILAMLGDIRDEQNLSAEEVLVFLAVGMLGITVTRAGVEVRPVPCSEISDLLHIPKETVRRRTAALIRRKMAAMTANGINVTNTFAWTAVARVIVRTG